MLDCARHFKVMGELAPEHRNSVLFRFARSCRPYSETFLRAPFVLAAVLVWYEAGK